MTLHVKIELPSQTRYDGRMRYACCALLTLLTACDASSIGNDQVDAPIGVSFDGPPSGGFDARVSCTRQTECGGTQICNPATMRCVASLSCQNHMQCGGEAYCNNGTCAPNALRGPCDVDENCVGQERCEANRCGCGGEQLGATAVPPNIVIALDRSGSMVTNTVPNSGGRSRWTVAKAAISQIADAYADEIRFGLTLWPGTNQSCTGSSQQQCQGVYSPVSLPGTANAIDSALGAAGTCGLGTPIAGTLNALAAQGGTLGLGDTARENFVLFVTDGAQNNCSGDEVAAVTALRNRTPSVRTFVVGFSGDVDATALNAIATAGGTARPGTPKYYQADDEDALLMAFQDIAGSIVACEYTLSVEPDSPDRLFVFVGSTQLNRDTTHANGWDYNATTKRLTFYGAACTTVRGGAGNLVVSLGCPVLP